MLRTVLLSAVVAAGLCFGVAPGADAQPLTDRPDDFGTAEVVTLCASNGSATPGGRCLDVDYGRPGAFAVVHARRAHANQQFRLDRNRAANAIVIRAMEEGSCLSPALDQSGSAKRNDALVIARCNGGAAQKWWQHTDGRLQNQATNQCIDIKNGSNGEGMDGLVLMWDCHSGWNQRWRPERVAAPPPPPPPPTPPAAPPTVSLSDWLRQALEARTPSAEIGQVVGRVISAGSGNVVTAGGLNVISPGSGNVLDVVLTVVSAGSGNVVSAGSGNVVSAGGLNLQEFTQGVVSAGSGNVVSAGGLNFTDALTVELVRRGVAQLAGRDARAAGQVVSAGALNLRSAGALDALKRSAVDAFIGNDAGSVVSAGGLNLQQVMAGVVSAGSGNVVSAGGLNLQSLGEQITADLAARVISAGGLNLQARAGLIGQAVEAAGINDYFVRATSAAILSSSRSLLSTGTGLNAALLRDNGFPAAYVDALVVRGLATEPPPVVVSNPGYQAPPSAPPPPADPPPPPPPPPAVEPPSADAGGRPSTTGRDEPRGRRRPRTGAGNTELDGPQAGHPDLDAMTVEQLQAEAERLTERIEAVRQEAARHAERAARVRELLRQRRRG